MTKIKHVFLGRFSPFQKGHQSIVEKLVNKYGISNVLILVGSSQSLDNGTPYTYKQRKSFIKSIYPQIEVLPLPDSSRNIKVFTDRGNEIWFDKIKKIEKKINAKFIFYGGSKEDLQILAQKFSTRVIVDRKQINISGTEVRKLLREKKYDVLNRYVDFKIIRDLVSIQI